MSCASIKKQNTSKVAERVFFFLCFMIQFYFFRLWLLVRKCFSLKLQLLIQIYYAQLYLANTSLKFELLSEPICGKNSVKTIVFLLITTCKNKKLLIAKKNPTLLLRTMFAKQNSSFSAFKNYNQTNVFKQP